MRKARALMALCILCAALCAGLALYSLVPSPARSIPLLPAKMPLPLSPMPQGPVAVNTAGTAELMQLPGVGPVTAEEIKRQRTIHPFFYPEDLLSVPGIALKKLEDIKPLISLP